MSRFSVAASCRRLSGTAFSRSTRNCRWSATSMVTEKTTSSRSSRSSRQGSDRDRKSTRLNSSHLVISYAVFCLKKKKNKKNNHEDKKITNSGVQTTRQDDKDEMQE